MAKKQTPDTDTLELPKSVTEDILDSDSHIPDRWERLRNRFKKGSSDEFHGEREKDVETPSVEMPFFDIDPDTDLFNSNAPTFEESMKEEQAKEAQAEQQANEPNADFFEKLIDELNTDKNIVIKNRLSVQKALTAGVSMKRLYAGLRELGFRGNMQKLNAILIEAGIKQKRGKGGKIL